MNRKLFFNLVFIIAGSFLLLAMGSIVTANFVKDARVFQKSVATIKEDTTVKTPVPTKNPSEEEKDDEMKTLTYERPPEQKVEKKDYGEAMPNTGDAGKTKIKVEVINFSGIKNLAEEIKTTLEANGYEVSAGNGSSNEPMKTMIIERNDKKAGAAIQGILKGGTVSKWPDPASRFDVTIKIGDDYKP